MTSEESFWDKVDRSSDDKCWEFPHKGKDGYGLFKVGGRTTRAHRYSWKLTRKCEIPEGKFICHLCNNRSCINPHHLYCGTRSDNIEDAIKHRAFLFSKGII